MLTTSNLGVCVKPTSCTSWTKFYQSAQLSAGMIVQCSKRRKRKKNRRRDRRSLSIMSLISQSRKMGENKTVNRRKKIKRIKLQAE